MQKIVGIICYPFKSICNEFSLIKPKPYSFSNIIYEKNIQDTDYIILHNTSYCRYFV